MKCACFIRQASRQAGSHAGRPAPMQSGRQEPAASDIRIAIGLDHRLRPMCPKAAGVSQKRRLQMKVAPLTLQITHHICHRFISSMRPFKQIAMTKGTHENCSVSSSLLARAVPSDRRANSRPNCQVDPLSSIVNANCS